MSVLIALCWITTMILTPLVAARQGRSVAGWLVLGVLFGLCALLVLLCLGPAVETATTQACPSCLATIPRAATVCRHCQRDVPVAAPRQSRRQEHGLLQHW